MKQIVINRCYGGWGLSDQAVRRYLELAGLSVYPEIEGDNTMLTTYWLVPTGPSRYDYKIASTLSSTWSEEEHQAASILWDEQVFDPRAIARDDPLLVQLVLELGDQAANWACVLGIVEIPDDVEWIIEECDGAEWIAEKHRTWN